MIAQTSVVVRYIVTAGVLSYAVSFPIYSEKDVRVTFSTDGRTETALVLGADYTVTVLSSGGGTVTLNSAGIVPAGAVLAVASAIPATQEADFSATTDVDTRALETQLDRQVQMIQQLEAELDRAVKVPAASEDTPEEVVQSVYAARDAAADSATDAARNAAEAGQSALAAAHSEQEAAASAADAAASADLAQSLTEVGPATSERLGFVRIGQGISVDETGLISIQSGIFQVGEGLELSKEGVLSASTFPVGGIIFWSGAANAIPRGWALCDGKNGTPNLQDKFVLGAGSTYNIGDTGGSTNITVSGTVGSTTIISSQMPKHSHSIYSNTGSQVGVTNGVNNSGANPATVTTSEAGGNMPHTHAATLTAEGDVLPPYYVLAYIMKI
ncbi:hypothetical protein HMPREF1022_02676 [Desulfovibrio sp. 6_1_46AFAA]|uniref:hypothetical protein n=1 Tax=Desulfovibrio sp. 6_1_46AFAA TaxID=665942 RepID=UPI000223730D|nr:hypothetical protein [Desulfovibrio sp. 6_1_46AFAA]EGW50303.1 hypothetical protein HMPREF1022_02676 [Desulfovibrio sp. 6_1_46AFAA]